MFISSPTNMWNLCILEYFSADLLRQENEKNLIAKIFQ